MLAFFGIVWGLKKVLEKVSNEIIGGLICMPYINPSYSVYCSLGLIK